MLLLAPPVSLLAAAEGGRLRAAGEELRKEQDPPAQTDQDDGHDHHHHGNRAHAPAHDDDHDNGIVLDLVLGLFVGLRAVSLPTYHRYPYDRHHDQAPAQTIGHPAAPPHWNGQFALLGGSDGQDLHWLGLEGRGLTPIGLGLGGQWLRYSEDLDGETVDAEVFDVSLVWRGFELPYGSFDWAVGYLGFRDQIGTENGAHFGLDLTVFPLRPLLVQAGASWGGIDSTSVNRYHLGVGAAWKNASLTLGHRWTGIGRVDLDGWEARLSWWF